jgi:hypothetical protein
MLVLPDETPNTMLVLGRFDSLSLPQKSLFLGNGDRLVRRWGMGAVAIKCDVGEGGSFAHDVKSSGRKSFSSRAKDGEAQKRVE